jgi:L-amino acid N-acyltransferase YncA
MEGRSSPPLVRSATVADAAACAAIYGPYVTDTAISFETVPPSPEQMVERIGVGTFGATHRGSSDAMASPVAGEG